MSILIMVKQEKKNYRKNNNRKNHMQLLCIAAMQLPLKLVWMKAASIEFMHESNRPD